MQCNATKRGFYALELIFQQSGQEGRKEGVIFDIITIKVMK